MGDGADMDGGQPQPSGWGPEEPVYQHSGFQPQYAPQYAPQPQYATPQYPTPTSPPRQQMRRSRRSSKVEQRLRMVQCFEELLSQPIFNDPSDPYASAVQDEISTFAQRRIDELFGEPSKPDASSLGFSPEEAAALKVLAQRMMAPDEEDAAQPVAPPPPPPQPVRPPPPPPAPVRGPRGCLNPGCQFPPHERNYPCSNAPPVQPPPQPQQRPPPPQAPQEPEEPLSAPQVIARPSPAQRAALEAARARPQPLPQQVPQRQPIPPPAPVRGRRGKRADTQPLLPAGPPPKPFPPPPKRYPMPQGTMMTMVTGQKAEEALASGGTVLSETFVKAPLR